MRVYHYLEARWALDDIRRRRLKLSKTDDMNDPYEWKCVYSSHRPSQEVLKRTSEKIADVHGALCFSRSWNNILMWSHYADKHKGICLGFDVPNKYINEVKYITKVDHVGNIKALSRGRKVRMINRLNCSKYAGWCYEEEVRMKGSREEMDGETSQHFVNFGENLKLKEVIAGARFPMTRRPIQNALKGYPKSVRVVKLRPSAVRFELIIDDQERDW